MKWTSASSSPALETFELWDGNRKLLTLDYHPFTNAARIEHAAQRRVFMIRREGFLRNRVVLRDEYGMRIGQLNFDKGNSHRGNIELENEKFNYTFTGTEERQLQMSRDQSGEPPVICDFKHGMPLGNLGTLPLSQQCLLMAFSWYLGLHAEKVPAAAVAL
jgi:hypothetical protein